MPNFRRPRAIPIYRRPGQYQFITIPGLVPPAAVQLRNDFPLFQATVLLTKHAFLVIPGLVPGMTNKGGRRSGAAQPGHHDPETVSTSDVHNRAPPRCIQHRANAIPSLPAQAARRTGTVRHSGTSRSRISTGLQAFGLPGVDAEQPGPACRDTGHLLRAAAGRGLRHRETTGPASGQNHENKDREPRHFTSRQKMEPTPRSPDIAGTGGYGRT